MIPAEVRYFCPRCGARTSRDGACDRDRTALSPMGPLLGTQVGSYVVVELLGEGGMGGVYRAVHPAIGAEVAIKVLHSTSAARAAVAHRFLGEAQAVNRVRHPSLVKILDTGTLADGRPYLVMELLDGISLAGVVGKLPPPIACQVVADAAEALDAVHREGIVHRDLKPANIFLTRQGRVVVLDFGIAKIVDAPASTNQSELVGTPEYMAPEQIRGEPVDRRADVYALGVVLYEMITGRRPFGAASTFETLVQHLERPPRSPVEHLPDLAPEIADVILRALAKHPDGRYPNAGELAAALRSAGGATTAKDVGAFVDAHARPAPPLPLDIPSVATRPDAPQARDRSELPWGGRFEETTQDVPAVAERAPAPPDEAPRRRARWWWPVALVVATAAGLAVWSAARAPAEEPAHGLVEIRANPPGATISIDHVPRGTAPLTVVLPAGAHYLHAEHAGRAPIDDAIEVRAGERASVMLVLPDQSGSAARVDKPATPVDKPAAPVDKPASTIVRTRAPPHRDGGSDRAPVEPAADREPAVEPPPPTTGRSPVTGRERKDNPFP